MQHKVYKVGCNHREQEVGQVMEWGCRQAAGCDRFRNSIRVNGKRK